MDFLLSRPSVGESLITHDRGITLQDAVDLRDAIQHVPSEVHRRYLVRCDPAGHLLKADVIHNTGRFLMMENSQRFNPALSQARNGTVAHSSG
jgi:hypothetical protein